MQEELSLPTTFGMAREARYQGLPDHVRKNVEYVEHLAQQTGNDVTSWSLSEIDYKKRWTRRELNKFFFNKVDAVQPDGELTEPEKQVLSQALVFARIHDERRRRDVIGGIEANRDYAIRQAQELLRSANQRISSANQLQKQLDDYTNAPSTKLNDELTQIAKSGFWGLESFNRQSIYFVTKQDIVLRQRNEAAGVDITLNVGKFRAALDLSSAILRVQRFSGNVDYHGYYHTYISNDGSICWGNASNTASDHLGKGKFADALSLLASLLTTYSPDSTPFIRLVDLARGVPGQVVPPSGADEGFEEATCDICDAITDDCECHYCEACDIRYADGDSCDGFYCERCETCTGSSPCEDHWCSTCETYNRGRCDCCIDCGRLDEDCDRCRDCDTHQGHTRDCPERAQAELNNTSQAPERFVF